MEITLVIVAIVALLRIRQSANKQHRLMIRREHLASLEKGVETPAVAFKFPCVAEHLSLAAQPGRQPTSIKG
jgi:hypothetical protein